MCLEEPCDDVMEMLTNSAKAQNKFFKTNKKIMGKFYYQSPFSVYLVLNHQDLNNWLFGHLVDHPNVTEEHKISYILLA